jgi:isopentenyldiphosphate isomerase
MAKKLPPLPDEVIEQARQLYNDGEGYQWRLGDYLVDVMDELSVSYAALAGGKASYFMHKSRAHILRQLSIGIGVEVSTLRDRECMARFYPQAVRQEFDALTYSQLRAAKSGGSDWRQYAERAVSNLPAPCTLIRSWINTDGNEQPVWEIRWEKLLNLVDAIADDATAPGWIRAACQEMDQIIAKIK